MISRDRFSNYIIGVPELGDEHWGIFHEMNQVITLFKNTTHALEEVVESMDTVILQLTTHLKTEEDYMHELRYPYLGYHKEAHARLVADAKAIRKITIASFTRELLGDALHNLGNTFLSHIDHHDSQMASWCAQHVLVE